MKVTYRGIKQEFSAKLQAKLDAKLAKLAKLLEKRGEKEAHVVVSSVRHLSKAEITIQFYDHQLLGVGTDADVFTAVSEAVDKIEIQAKRNVDRWRGKQRRKVNGAASEPASDRGGNDANPAPIPVTVHKANHRNNRKPMTLDEAMIEMEQDRDFLVYRDAEKENTSILVRRRDGRVDLIEV